MSYLAVPELSEYVRSTIVADQVEIGAAAVAASSSIDWFCGRTFTVPTEGTSRTLHPYPAGETILVVPDISKTEQVNIVEDGVTLTSTVDFAFDEPEAPYTQIRRIGGTWGTEVVIDAWWGWPETPEEVIMSTKLLVRDLLLARDTAFGLVQVGEYSRRIAENGVVAMILEPFRRDEALGVA